MTEYCDKNQHSTRDRLELFITVCQAVQHAHQKGVIHRDIKPNNILVTLHDGLPVVKVIDFGVAKAINQQLTEKTLFTAYGQMVGTPQYMSPEQAEMSGLDVDTRSDIYSLGVLLYELLTGETPLDAERLRSAGFGEIQRIIREEEPPKPSRRISTAGEKLTVVSQHRRESPQRLHRLLRGDLDWIVMKALEKDRSRRYETAVAFSEDVWNHLHDRTVDARPPSTLYRLRKLCKQYRGFAATTGLVFVMIILALVWFSYSSMRLAEERDRANREAKRAKEVVVQLRNTLFDQGLSYILTADYQRAEEAIQNIRDATDSQLAEQLHALMVLQRDRPGDVVRTLEIVRKAVEREPESIPYQSLLAMSYRRLGRFDDRNVVDQTLAELDPATYEDFVFAALAPADNSTVESIARVRSAFQMSRSPVLLLMLSAEEAEFACKRRDLEAADQALENANATKQLLGVKSSFVRFTYLGTVLNVAITQRLHDRDWRETVRQADVVARAIANSPHPSFLERQYLGMYYLEADDPRNALNQLKSLDLQTPSMLGVVWYLAVDAEYDLYADPEYIESLRSRHDHWAIPNAVSLYLAMRGRIAEAREISAGQKPANAWQMLWHIMVLQGIDAAPTARIKAAESLQQWPNLPSDFRLYFSAIAEDWEDDRLVDAATRLVEESPDSANAWHFRLGFRFLARNDPARAKHHFRQCLEHRRNVVDIYALWARSLDRRLDGRKSWPPEKS